MKFDTKGPIYNIPVLVQLMPWRRLGDKSLSEPMVVNSPTHICDTGPQWANGNFRALKFKTCCETDDKVE